MPCCWHTPFVIVAKFNTHTFHRSSTRRRWMWVVTEERFAVGDMWYISGISIDMIDTQVTRRSMAVSCSLSKGMCRVDNSADIVCYKLGAKSTWNIEIIKVNWNWSDRMGWSEIVCRRKERGRQYSEECEWDKKGARLARRSDGWLDGLWLTGWIADWMPRDKLWIYLEKWVYCFPYFLDYGCVVAVSLFALVAGIYVDLGRQIMFLR